MIVREAKSRAVLGARKNLTQTLTLLVYVNIRRWVCEWSRVPWEVFIASFPHINVDFQRLESRWTEYKRSFLRRGDRHKWSSSCYPFLKPSIWITSNKIPWQWPIFNLVKKINKILAIKALQNILINSLHVQG